MKQLFFATFILIACIAVSVFASTIQLPKTGQMTCYDTDGNVISCEGTGQDGELQIGVTWPDPRFTNSDNSTPITGDVVVDQLTGLMWARSANLMPSRNPGWDNDEGADDGRVAWQHALDYVAKLNNEGYLGYSDWRLPNLNELESLIYAKVPDSSTWLISQGFISVQPLEYWSSTNYGYPYGTDCAWSVNMHYGEVRYYSKSGNTLYVWPVRTALIYLPKTGQTECYDSEGDAITCAGTGQDGELQMGVAWPSPRFTDNGNGTVSDNLTGLIWLKDANPVGYTGDWPVALAYCNNMQSGMAGLTDGSVAGDWRLPNKEELRSLCDYSQYFPTLPKGHPFTIGVESSWYWSSTTCAYYTGNAWIIDTVSGSVGCGSKYSTVGGYVWPVRSSRECWNFITLSAQSLQTVLMRPFFFEQRCPWLVLNLADDNHFDQSSTITLQGPSEAAAGVVIDQNRTALKFWQFILVPLCIDKDATAGQWNLAIDTNFQGSACSFKETIEASFEVQ